jgi:hypothetical protein
VHTGKAMGLQAPCATVDLYGTTLTDTDKLQGGMVTELDYGVGNVTAALERAGMWANTVLVLVSDNGAQLDHGYNAPLRGGKHTFWEGGVRVVSLVHSPLLPAARAGTVFDGMAHSSDWYATFGALAGGGAFRPLAATGVRPPDGLDLWPALSGGLASPRTEVVHQVSNRFYNASTGTSYDAAGSVLSQGDCDGSCGEAIRVGNFKLILGRPGDKRVMAWPEVGPSPTPFGLSGGEREPGTDHCRAVDGHTKANLNSGTWLYDLAADLNETNNLAGDASQQERIRNMTARLKEAGALHTGPAAYAFARKADQKRASEAVCAQMHETGFLEPSDLTPQPAPTPAAPTPPTPPTPLPPPPAQQCEAAGGILGKDGACCAKSCGVCGGKDCGKLPGGDANCCTNKVAHNGKDCKTDTAPCSVS